VVKKFLALTSYYRNFIKGYTQLAESLAELTRQTISINNKKFRKRFQWTPQCQSAFEQFIDVLSTAPILAHPNHEQRYRCRVSVPFFHN
jgi:hypothetical protein